LTDTGHCVALLLPTELFPEVVLPARAGWGCGGKAPAYQSAVFRHFDIRREQNQLKTLKNVVFIRVLRF
jgi:hypothetical protein